MQIEINALALSGLVIAISSIILALVALRFGRMPQHIIWALFNLTIALWGIGMLLVGVFKTNPATKIGWIIGVFGGTFIPVTFFHVVYLLCELKSKKILVFAYLQGAVFAILSYLDLSYPLNLYFCKLRPAFNQFYFIRSTGISFWIFSILWIFFVIYGFYHLVKCYNRSFGNKKNQIFYITIATFIGFLGGTSTFLPYYGIFVFPYGNFTIWIYTGIATYAILRYNLLDINVIVTRSSILLGIYIFIFMVPLLVVSLWQDITYRYLGAFWWGLPLGLFIFLATLGPFLYLFFLEKTELKQKEEWQKNAAILEETAQGLIEVENINTVARLIPQYFDKFYGGKTGTKIEFVLFYIYDANSNTYKSATERDNCPHSFTAENFFKQWFLGIMPQLLGLKLPAGEKINILRFEDIERLANDSRLDKKDAIKNTILEFKNFLAEIKAAVCIPSLYKNQLLGFIILGEKKSGTYSEKEFDLFSRLSMDIAMSIKSVRLSQELKFAQARLAESERLAAVGRLANTIAHEIKNPLTAIKTFTEFLNEKFDDKEFRDKFQRIVGGEVDRINTIVEQLNNFAHPKPIKLEEASISEIIDATLALLENDLYKKSIKVVKGYAGYKTINADKNQMKQVFLNLFINSIDAMESSAVKELKIKTYDANNSLTIEISDTGIGIPNEKRKDIFAPFYTTKDKGLGLGLAIVSSIIKKHSGEIELKENTADGAATTFLITFPA